MMSEPVNAVRRRLLKDLLSYAVGSYIGLVTQPMGMLLKGPPEAAQGPDLATQRKLEILRSGLAEKVGISPYRLDESHVGDLIANLRSAIGQQEATLSISREELAGLVAAYAGATVHREKGLYITDLQFSKAVKRLTFDIVAHVSFGKLCVRLGFGQVTEKEVSELSSFCVAPNVEEGWLVAPDLEERILRGSPIGLWENKYLFPIVRLISYQKVFDELLSPIQSSFKSRVETEGQTLVLRLSQQTRSPGSTSSQGSKGGFGAAERSFSAR